MRQEHWSFISPLASFSKEKLHRIWPFHTHRGAIKLNVFCLPRVPLSSNLSITLFLLLSLEAMYRPESPSPFQCIIAFFRGNHIDDGFVTLDTHHILSCMNFCASKLEHTFFHGQRTTLKTVNLPCLISHQLTSKFLVMYDEALYDDHFRLVKCPCLLLAMAPTRRRKFLDLHYHCKSDIDAVIDMCVTIHVFTPRGSHLYSGSMEMSFETWIRYYLTHSPCCHPC